MILNLVYPNKSDIKYKISKFPDGQQNIVIDASDLSSLQNLITVTIYSRLNNWKDLELIVAANQAIKGIKGSMGFPINRYVSLYIPYLLGARSDRKFETGGNHYLKDVVGPVINSQGFTSVTILDPHSNVTEAVIDNLIKVDNIGLVKWALDDIWLEDALKEPPVIIGPDKGSEEKIHNVAKALGIKDVIIASKNRNPITGDIISITVPDMTEYSFRDIVVIDDICDGGRTFNELSKAIDKTCSVLANKYLIVTHGIFSAGFDELSKHFKSIYSTNSVYSYPSGSDPVNGHFLKQMEVFL